MSAILSDKKGKFWLNREKENLLTEEEGEARDEDGRQDPRAEGQGGPGRRRRRRRGIASR